MKRMTMTIGAAAVTAIAGQATATFVTVTFQEGVNDYFGTYDTHLNAAAPNTNYGNDLSVTVDGGGGGSVPNHALLWFMHIFGNGPNQIPFGTTILSATLTLNALQPGAVITDMHRMVQPWTENDTWKTPWLDGIQADGFEAASVIDATIDPPVLPGSLNINLTSSVQGWSDGAANYGWVLLARDNSPDGWKFSSSEAIDFSLRPLLVVEFIPAPGTLALLGLFGLFGPRRRRLR